MKMLLGRLLFFTVLFCFPAGAIAQEHYSIENNFLIPSVKPFDTIGYRQLTSAAKLLETTKPKQALLYYQKALIKCKEGHYRKGYIKALIDVGYCYNKLGAFEQGINYTKQAVAEGGPDDDFKLNAFALSNIGLFYAERGDCNQSINAMQQALFYCTRMPVNDYRQLLLNKIYNTLAWSYYYNAKYGLSAYYCYKELEYIDHPDKYTKKRMHVVYNSVYTILSGDWDALGVFDQALFCANKAEQIAQIANDTDLMALAIVNEGSIYEETKSRDKELQYFLIAQKLAAKTYDTDLQVIVLTKLADFFLDEHKPGSAMYYGKQALQIDNKNKGVNITSSVRLSYTVGETYYQLKNYKQAERYIVQAILRAKEKGLINEIKTPYSNLASVYGALGEYKKAFESEQVANEVNDSLKGKENTQIINSLEIKYHVAEKDKQLVENNLLLLKQENNLKEKDLLIGGISIGVLLLIILLVFLYRTNKHKQSVEHEKMRMLQQKQEILEREQEILKQGQQITQLKAIMKGEEQERTRIARELHDGIGGMLTALNMNLGRIQKKHQDAPQIKDLNEVMSMLQDTAMEVRKTAHNLMPDILMRHNFRKALEIYCDTINVGSTLEIDLQFYGNIDELGKANELILYRIAQELIQNIVKHANATYAAIQIREHNEKLTITVEDNGTGFNVSDVNGGYGLQNLRYRVQALHGEIHIESAKGKHTTIYIEFDIQKLKNNTAI